MKLQNSKSARQAIFLYVSTILGVLIGVGVSVLNTRVLPAADLADYAYVLGCCRFAASVSDDASRRRIVALCDGCLAKIRRLEKDRGRKRTKTAVVDSEALFRFDDPQLTEAKLIGLHSMSQQISAFLHKRKMETSHV